MIPVDSTRPVDAHADAPRTAFAGPRFADVLAAAARIAPHARRTPVLRSHSLNAIAGCDLHFKCENFQRVGAFKFRGACNAVQALDADRAARGVPFVVAARVPVPRDLPERIDVARR